MPYKKPTPKPFEGMTRLLKGYDINAPALAKILDCSVNTARRKLTEPKYLNLEDIIKIHHRGHIAIDELREQIRDK